MIHKLGRGSLLKIVWRILGYHLVLVLAKKAQNLKLEVDTILVFDKS